VAKKQKVARQKANSGAREADSIHGMSISVAKNTNSDMLKDHTAAFVRGNAFFCDKLQKQTAATLGQFLLAQANSNASRSPSQEIAAGQVRRRNGS
jgi:hypothetical protein